jgi:hypothetical protein
MDLFRKLALSTGQAIETVSSADYEAAGTINVNSDYRVDIAEVLRAMQRSLA